MNGFDLLQNMHTISLDLETTGIKPSDQIWSGGFYSTKDGTVLNKHESFFHITDKAKNAGYDKNTSTEDLVSFLRGQHSSKEFGDKQAGIGTHSDGTARTNVLQGWAEAVGKGEATHVNDFVSELNKEIGKSTTGSMLLIQNVNFEDRVLSNLHAQGSIPAFNSFTKNLQSKGIPANPDPRYGQPFDRHLLPKEIQELRGTRDKTYRAAMDAFGNKENITTHLNAHYKDSLAIIEQYKVNVSEAVKNNTVAVTDLMDFSRALYAHGAVSGQVAPELLSFGSKVETLATALLGEKELHSSLSDAVQQKSILNQLTEELKVIETKGKDYQSPLIDKLLKQMEKDKTYSTQLKERALNVVREHLEGSSTVTKDSLNNALNSRFYSNNRHLSSIEKEGFKLSDYYEKLQNEVSGFFDEKGNLNKDTDRESIVKKLDIFSNEYKLETKTTSKIEIAEKALTSKTAKIGGAALTAGIVGSMLFGGDTEKQKEVKTTTYNELYDKQYYGSAFADWQNRNNSHKMN